MNFRITVCALLAFGLTGCSPSTGLYRWIPFVGNGKKSQPTEMAKIKKGDPFGPISGRVVYGLELRTQVEPQPVRLADTRSLEVHIQLINRTKKPINLRFTDSKHFDLVLRDAGGKKLAQWSDDQPVVANPGVVIIDPAERAEFIGNVSTRDMVAGRNYTVDAIVVGYEELRQNIALAPAR